MLLALFWASGTIRAYDFCLEIYLESYEGQIRWIKVSFGLRLKVRWMSLDDALGFRKYFNDENEFRLQMAKKSKH